VSKSQRIFIGDLLGRIGIVIYFVYAVVRNIVALRTEQIEWKTLTVENKELWLLSHLSILFFLLLAIVTTIFRIQPINTAEGIEPRITALAGTFLLALLALAPERAQLPPSLAIVALVLVIVGFGLSTYVLYWLGQSFSIMAEARRLVTGGPFAYVRHPLYLAEEIANIGIILLNFSPVALLTGIIHWCLQLRRMHNEERVLNAAFPDYCDYSAVTPRVIPSLRQLSNGRRRSG
jgi:protein-S-isoprenylcysteine O-methyltransferase Ste14